MGSFKVGEENNKKLFPVEGDHSGCGELSEGKGGSCTG